MKRKALAWTAAVIFTATFFLLLFALRAEGGCRHTGRCVAPVRHHVAAAVVADHHDDYKFFVGQSLRDEAIAEKAALKILRVQYQIEMDRLTRGANGGGSSPLEDVPAKLLDKPAGAGDAVNWSKCTNCHNPTKPGRMDLSDTARKSLSCEDKMDILRKVRSGEMPKNGTLTDVEYEAFVDWCLR